MGLSVFLNQSPVKSKYFLHSIRKKKSRLADSKGNNCVVHLIFEKISPKDFFFQVKLSPFRCQKN